MKAEKFPIVPPAAPEDGLPKKTKKDHLKLVPPEETPEEKILFNTNDLERLDSAPGATDTLIEVSKKKIAAETQKARESKQEIQADRLADLFLYAMQDKARAQTKDNPNGKVDLEAAWRQAHDVMQERVKTNLAKTLPVSEKGMSYLMENGFPPNVVLNIRPMDKKGVVGYEGGDRAGIRDKFSALIDRPAANVPEIPPLMAAFNQKLVSLREDIQDLQKIVRHSNPLESCIPTLLKGDIDKEKFPLISPTLLAEINEAASTVRAERTGFLIKKPLSEEEQTRRMYGIIDTFIEPYKTLLQIAIQKRAEKLIKSMDSLFENNDFKKAWNRAGALQTDLEKASADARFYMEQHYAPKSYRPEKE